MSDFSVPSRRASHTPLLLILLAILMIVIVGLSAFIYSLVSKRPAVDSSSTSLGDYLKPVSDLVTNDDTVSAPTSGFITFSPLPESEIQSYPVNSAAGLVLVPLTPNSSPIAVNDAGLGGSYSLGLGSSTAQAAPDLKTIAFLGEKGRLHLITADGHHKVSLPPNFQVGYLSGWSADSKQLLAYAQPTSVDTSFGGPHFGDTPTNIEFEPNLWPKGFYLVDAKAGTVKTLTPLIDVQAWKGSSQLLVGMGQDSVSSPWYGVFDLANFTLNPAILEKTFQPYFGPQIDFSADGNTWAVTLHKGTENARIVLADFPNLEGQVVAEGDFAAVQGPIISPNGQRVIYRKYDFVNGPNYVQLWKDGVDTRVGQGIPMDWVDDKYFLMAEMNPDYSSNPDNHLSKLLMVDSDTGTSVTLFTK